VAPFGGSVGLLRESLPATPRPHSYLDIPQPRSATSWTATG